MEDLVDNMCDLLDEPNEGDEQDTHFQEAGTGAEQFIYIYIYTKCTKMCHIDISVFTNIVQ